MQAWQQAAVGASFLIALHYLLLRAASGRVGDSLGALILEGTAAIGILAAYVIGFRGDAVVTTRSGLLFAAVSGLCISVASIIIFFALRRGGPVASTGTIVMGGGVAISALVAPFVFREPLTLRRIVGVAFGLLAIVILSTERSPTDSADANDDTTTKEEKKEAPP